MGEARKRGREERERERKRGEGERERGGVNETCCKKVNGVLNGFKS